ncbi:helix-turn-helix domain-containing protein [Dokdonia sinensis]|nr:helix-turn-helix domain-containing protein [Dokdonia sinensis]
MFLALLIITFSYNNLQFYISGAGILPGNLMYATFYIPVGSLIPVFIIQYVQEFLNFKENKKSRSSLLLYLPFSIFLILAIALKIDSIGNVNAVSKPVWQNIGKVQSLFSMVYTLALIAISFIKVRRSIPHFNRKKQKQVAELRWLHTMLFILFILTLLWGLALFKYITNVSFKGYFTALWIGLSLAIYWLGHIGIYKYGIRQERKSLSDFSKKLDSNSDSQKASNGHIASIHDIVKTKKRYLDATFSLELLAQELQLSTSHLSRVFNNEMQTSFSDYINALRVEEAKRYLKNPEFKNYTLVAIGLEAGFNSKTTFNTTFKKMTGQTPSQFKKAN